jgi:hypothetical protein
MDYQANNNNKVSYVTKCVLKSMFHSSTQYQYVVLKNDSKQNWELFFTRSSFCRLGMLDRFHVFFQ